MNTLAMNVRYSADSGFLEESLVQLLSTKPLMNSTQKKPSSLFVGFSAGVFTMCFLCQQGLGCWRLRSRRGSYRLKCLWLSHTWTSIWLQNRSQNKWSSQMADRTKQRFLDLGCTSQKLFRKLEIWWADTGFVYSVQVGDKWKEQTNCVSASY